MIVGPAAVVVHVRRDQVLRHGLDGVDEVAVHVRVAEVEADADLPGDRARPRRSARATRPGTARSGSPRPRSSRRAARRAAAVRRCCAARRRGCCRSPTAAAFAAGRCASRARSNGMRRAICSARSVSSIARARVSGSALASVSGGPQRPPAKLSPIGACTPCSSSRPPPATAAGRRPPPGCDSRNAFAWRTARLDRSRAPRSRAGALGSAGSCGTGASRSRTLACRPLEPFIVACGTGLRHKGPPAGGRWSAKLLDVPGQKLAQAAETRGTFRGWCARSGACAACTGCRRCCRASIVW